MCSPSDAFRHWYEVIHLKRSLLHSNKTYVFLSFALAANRPHWCPCVVRQEVCVCACVCVIKPFNGAHYEEDARPVPPVAHPYLTAGCTRFRGGAQLKEMHPERAPEEMSRISVFTWNERSHGPSHTASTTTTSAAVLVLVTHVFHGSAEAPLSESEGGGEETRVWQLG